MKTIIIIWILAIIAVIAMLLYIDFSIANQAEQVMGAQIEMPAVSRSVQVQETIDGRYLQGGL